MDYDSDPTAVDPQAREWRIIAMARAEMVQLLKDELAAEQTLHLGTRAELERRTAWSNERYHELMRERDDLAITVMGFEAAGPEHVVQECDSLEARVRELEAERDRLVSDIGAINNDWQRETMRKLAAESEARALRAKIDRAICMLLDRNAPDGWRVIHALEALRG